MTDDAGSHDAPFADLRRHLGDALLAGLDPERAIVMLWSLDGERIFAASRAAIRFFGGFASEDLTGRRFGPALPSTTRIAEISRRLDNDEQPRAERIRFFIGSRSDLLSCVCRRIATENGDEALLVIANDPRSVGRSPELMPGLLAARPAAPDTAASKAMVDAEPSAVEAPPTPLPIALKSRAPLPRRPVRFVFETDAAGRIAQLSPQLAEIVGAERATLVGRTFAEVGGALGVSGAEAVTSRLDRGEGWQGVALEWPVGTTSLRVPVELSGLPLYDAERRPRGFRGFGVIRLDTVSEEKLSEAERRPDAVAEPALLPGVTEPPAEERTAAPAIAASGPEPSNIVALGSARTQPPASQPAASQRLPTPEGANENAPATTVSGPPAAPRPATPAEETEKRLSTTDRNAFREIARALGARLADDMPEPPGATRRNARVETLPAPAIVAPPATAVVEPPAPPAAMSEASAGLVTRQAATQAEPAGQDLAETSAVDLKPGVAVVADTAAEPKPDEFAEPEFSEPEFADPQFAEHEPAEHEPVEPSPAETMDTGTADAILDQLPIGILVTGGSDVLFLNRTLLDLLGQEDIAAVRDLGAPSVFFDKLPEINAAGIERRSLMLADGSRTDVIAHAQAIDWHGTPATLVSIRSAALPHPAPSENAGVQAADPAPVPLANPAPAPDLSLLESRAVDLQQRLRSVEAEREEFRAILDTATDGVISLDAEGRITGLNRSAEALFGVDQNEVAGQRFSVLLAGESHASALDYLDGLKSGGVASVLNDGREVIAREKKGGRIPLFMTLGRISDRDSGRFCAVLRDLTAWKKAEAELTDSKRVAERASQMKSDFLAKISHEIRTPMNAIIGFSEVMRTEQFGPIGSERYRDYLGDIHRSGEHVISLVNDLLDLSKIEAGRAELAFTSVSLNDIVAECVSMMQPQAARERVIMRSNLAERMPHVVADERSIKQVVLNLLSNACKFNQPGGQVIVSTALSDNDEAVIRVRDTGIGMSEKDIEGAMQPFRQMSPTRRGGGTGLGLPLTKALIEANRASLTIRSAMTEGTLVEVTFPATRVLAE